MYGKKRNRRMECGAVRCSAVQHEMLLMAREIAVAFLRHLKAGIYRASHREGSHK